VINEHPGQVFKGLKSPSTCGKGVLNGVNSTGVFHNISGISTYLAYPKDKKTDIGILYLSDIFGVSLINNQLLADSFAAAGFFVVEPDLFAGDPVLLDQLGDPSFNITAWLEKHPMNVIDSIVETTINSMRTKLGVKKIGAVGYCFGGKYVTRFLAPGKGLDAGFTAHPSAVVPEEYEGVAGPLSIAFGELDASNTPAQRAAAEATLQAKNANYQTSLYSGAEHGFAVRTNLSDSRKRFAQESAYFQAVRWFDAWVK